VDASASTQHRVWDRGRLRDGASAVSCTGPELDVGLDNEFSGTEPGALPSCHAAPFVVLISGKFYQWRYSQRRLECLRRRDAWKVDLFLVSRQVDFFLFHPLI
jgi:hypothetical protein